MSRLGTKIHNMYKNTPLKPCKYTIKTEKTTTFIQKKLENAKKEKNNDKTLYFWSNKFTPAKKILHNCWL